MSQALDRSPAEQVPDPATKKRPKRSAPQKVARLNARLTPQQKALLQRAASLAERPLSEFVIAMAAERAAQIIQEHLVLELSMRDSDIFAAAVLQPAIPSTGLQEAARLHEQLITD